MGNGYDVKANFVVDEVTRGTDNAFFNLHFQYYNKGKFRKDKLKNLVVAAIDLAYGDDEPDNTEEVYQTYKS